MRPRSAVEYRASSSTQMPQISSRVDLSPTTHALAILPRAKSASRLSTGDFSRRSTLTSDSASSVQSVADGDLSVVDIENLLLERVRDKKDDLKVAFEAFDLEGSKTVTRGEFKRIIEGFLVPLTDFQFEGLLAQLDLKENGTISYLEFLRRYCKVSSAVSRIPCRSEGSRITSLGELQCRLKDKMGGNLKNITRAFHLFDYNNDGQIQQHELRKVLEGYCFPISPQEFNRLWSHYNVNNTGTISYKEFLVNLGVDCEKHRKAAADSVQMALNWDAVSQTTARGYRRSSVRATSGKSRGNMDEVQTRFLKHIKKNLRFVEKALRAFDVSKSGLVSLEDLRSVLSNFLFPMENNIFRMLLNRFGVNITEPVKWKVFLGLFEDGTRLEKNPTLGAPDKSSTESILSKLHQNVYNQPLLSQALMDFDKNKTGFISREDLCMALENLNCSLTHEQFSTLADFLDEENTDVINYQRFLDLLHLQNPPMEVLKQKLLENYDALMESIINITKNQSDTVLLEELRKLINHYGQPLTEQHFSRLCEPYLEGSQVYYKRFLKSLGVPEKMECVVERKDAEREASTLNRRKQDMKVIVLRKLKERLQRRRMTLPDYLMSIRKNKTAELTLRDFSKVLDDCGISLEESQLQMLKESLGFNAGPISVDCFMDEYEDVEIPDKDEEVQRSTFLTAEECLDQLRSRIVAYHGDVLTAFRFMDKNRDGLVNLVDFRPLFDSLMFVTQEREYQKFLHFLGLKPGATLNFADFSKKVLLGSEVVSLNDILRDGCLENPCDQVHNYLADLAQRHPSKFSEVFCHLSDDCKRILTKNGLKQLLFKHYMPVTPNEFENLWSRFDEDGNGFVTQTEFLKKLEVTVEKAKEPGILSEKSSDSEFLLQKLRKWIGSVYGSVSRNLVILDKNKEGHVTVAELLSLLQRHGFELTDNQLTHLLNLLGFDACLKELPYLDFLTRLVGHPGDTPEGPATHSTESLEDVEELSPGRAIQKLKELVTSSTETLHKAFSAFDKTGDGLVTQVEFRQVLDNFCICLSNVQFRKLLSELPIKEGEETTVDWKEFLKVFNLDSQETADEWVKKIRKIRFPNQSQPLTISEILKRIQEVVSARIYTITQEMIDLDYANKNTISRMDFKTICARHFMRLSDNQFQSLWKLVPVDANGNLEYREFLNKFSGEHKSLEISKSLPVSARSKMERPTPLRRPKTAPCTLRCSATPDNFHRPSTAGKISALILNCEDVEIKVRPRIQNCWKLIQRRCRQADPERTGEVPVATFMEILKDLHIGLSSAEFKQLSVKYDIKASGRVSYLHFLRHFVLMFSGQGDTSSRRLKLQPPRTLMSPGPLSTQCVETMLRISRPVQLVWREMRQRFISFDKERTGKVSLLDFRKVLKQFSLNLSEEEFFYFTSFFDKNLSGRIPYNDFLRIFLK